MPFSHYRQGETSFEFLGFEFRWGVNRKGQAWLKRRIARKKLRHSLKRVTEWCRQNRHRRLREQVQLLNAKLRGYNHYYEVNGNRASLDEFFYRNQLASEAYGRFRFSVACNQLRSNAEKRVVQVSLYYLVTITDFQHPTVNRNGFCLPRSQVTGIHKSYTSAFPS